MRFCYSDEGRISGYLDSSTSLRYAQNDKVYVILTKEGSLEYIDSSTSLRYAQNDKVYVILTKEGSLEYIDSSTSLRYAQNDKLYVILTKEGSQYIIRIFLPSKIIFNKPTTSIE